MLSALRVGPRRRRNGAANSLSERQSAVRNRNVGVRRYSPLCYLDGALLNRSYKTITLAVQRQNDALGLPPITHRLAYCPYHPLECSLTNELPRPYLSAQLLCRNDSISMLQEIQTHPEHLGSQADGLPAALHAIKTSVQLTIAKDIDHGLFPCEKGPGPTADHKENQALRSDSPIKFLLWLWYTPSAH
jgi:hypothetical protein